jgi:hypothetical protein
VLTEGILENLQNLRLENRKISTKLFLDDFHVERDMDTRSWSGGRSRESRRISDDLDERILLLLFREGTGL